MYLKLTVLLIEGGQSGSKLSDNFPGTPQTNINHTFESANEKYIKSPSWHCTSVLFK